ncbi:amidohydrolase family protein [Streptomyces sp. MP131-18]|uniref:amidohydrolase family protein n=1 Tax=Streptomyces sp. MP131-18 TaxID=1857892 RepID=UPI0009A1CF16|nr:amidohydrolase family protein [Streptomyces sp. MP131-18]ONK15533.1 putative metal-dependent hydrolase of the TIM-barrel fold protein [Streptomyces sp. MP131-18]
MLAADQEFTGRPWMDAIDVHHHILPDFYRDALEDIGIPTILPGVDKPSWSVDSSLTMMDRHGIRAAVVSIWPGVPPMAPKPAAAFARRVNEYLAGLAAANPGRFGAFATLPFPHMDAVVQEFVYAVDTLGLDGAGLISNYGGLYVGDPAMDPLFAEAARRRSPLFVHPTVPPATDQPMFGLPASLYEFPFESVRVAAQLLYNRTLERFPGLPVILPHGGGGVAYYAGRLASGGLISPPLADRLPADPIGSLQGLYFDVAMTGDAHALAALRSFAPASQILVGSDFPLMPESYTVGTGRFVVEHGGFSTEDLRGIDHGNARALFPRFNGQER